MLYLRTFGTCALERADGDRLDLQRRPLALLAFVAAAGTRGATREKALGLLWPNADEDRARHSLAQTVYALKRACDADPVEGGAGLRLDEAVISADILEFERAIASGDHERAAQLYTGAFLDGLHLPNAGEFERWMDGERARLQRLAKKAIETGATRAADAGDHRRATEWWRRAAGLDPLDSRVALALVQSLAAGGETPAANNQAGLHQQIRRTELDLAPDAALAAFAQRLRSDPPAARPAAPPLPDTRAEPAQAAVPVPNGMPPAGAGAAAHVRPRGPYILRWGAAAIALGVIVAGGVVLTRNRRAQHLTSSEHRVVVAVFDNRTSDTTLDPLGEMAADWVSTELARTGLVDVVDSRAAIASTAELGAGPSSFGMSRRTRDLARSVGAGIVVWGNYYRRGDTLEFHPQISDVRDGALLREVPPVLASVKDPMAGVRQLAGRVMGALATIENPRLGEWATHAGAPPSYAAYREFVDGLDAQVQMDAATSLVHYRRARALDTTFLQPLLFAADAEHTLGHTADAEADLDTVEAQRDKLIPADRYRLDFQFAETRGQSARAYQLASELALVSPTSESFAIAGQSALFVARPGEALKWFERVDPTKGWVKGWSEYWMEAAIAAHLSGNNKEALRLAHAARRAFPDQVIGYAAFAPALAGLGQVDAVEAELDSAAAAPGQIAWRYDEALHLAACELTVHGHPDASRVLWQRAIQWYASRPPDAASPPDMRDLHARILIRLGRSADAERLAHALVRQTPEEPMFMATLGMAEAEAKDSAGARAELARLAHIADTVSHANVTARGQVALARGRLSAALGDRAAAVAFLTEALHDRTILIYQLHRHLAFEPLWGYPPFQELARVRG
ncbi:MAG: BTAD domain-containing putative transcriptional regulator [Gemmatimonadaceae bacterium]